MKAMISMAAIVLAIAMTTPARAQDTPEALYKAKCAMCHGPDGAGSAVGKKMGVKDFKDPEIVKASDASLIKDTKEGKRKMPKFEGKLSDDQIKDVVQYIRTLQKK